MYRKAKFPNRYDCIIVTNPNLKLLLDRMYVKLDILENKTIWYIGQYYVYTFCQRNFLGKIMLKILILLQTAFIPFVSYSF